MRLGILLSALLHTAVILASIVVLPSVWDNAEEFEMIPVEILTISDETNVIAKTQEVPPEEEIVEPPQVKETPVAQEAPPPVPEPEPVVQDEMPPLPEPEPEKKPEPKPEPKKVEKDSAFAEARPRRKPTPPAPQKSDELDFDQIAALLDKTPTEPEQQKAKEEDDPLDDFLASLATDNQRAIGMGTDLTMSEKDALRQHIFRCWRPPTGAANPEELIVDLKIYLSRDGMLARPTEVISVGRSSFGTNTFAMAAENAARRAVEKCEPYDFLPDDKYETWRVIEMKFDPGPMIGK